MPGEQKKKKKRSQGRFPPYNRPTFTQIGLPIQKAYLWCTGKQVEPVRACPVGCHARCEWVVRMDVSSGWCSGCAVRVDSHCGRIVTMDIHCGYCVWIDALIWLICCQCGRACTVSTSKCLKKVVHPSNWLYLVSKKKKKGLRVGLPPIIGLLLPR